MLRRKSVLFVVGLLLFSYQSVMADAPSNQGSVEQRLDNLEKKAIVGQPARPTKENTAVFFTGEGLYWKAEQAGLEFGVLESNDTDSTALFTVTEKVRPLNL